MKCTVNSPRGPHQTKPASLLISLKQTIGLIFNKTRIQIPPILVFAAGKEAMKEQLAFLLMIG